MGGGDATLLIAVLHAHAELHGTVLDLPGPVGRAEQAIASAGLGHRAGARAGSFFDALPAGAGGYLLSVSQIKKSLASKATASLKIKISSYSGLGVPALYFTEAGGGIDAQGINALLGKESYGADVYTTTPTSKLAALAKLAAKLAG